MSSQVEVVLDSRDPRVRWLECESVRRWRGGVRASTFQTYWSWMRRFLSHVGKDPDEFLQWCRGQPEKWEILEVLQQFIRKFESKRYGTCESGYSSLKSFLLHNRIDLPRDLSFQIHAETPPVERQITLENLRELIMLAPQPQGAMTGGLTHDCVSWPLELPCLPLSVFSVCRAESLSPSQEDREVRSLR